MSYTDRAQISSLVGLVLSKIVVNDEKTEILFKTECGRIFKMHHFQDCCESVSIDDITGDLANLVGHPILMAEEATQNEVNPAGVCKPQYQGDSFTWTFYKFATIKGYVDVRWYGESNGYYSESVDFEELTQ